MLWTIALIACSLVLSVLLTPLLRQFALRRGWVDQPDNNRKLHKLPIPRIGGVPIVLAYAGSVGIILLIGATGKFPVYDHLTVTWSLLIPAFLVFIIGLLDDLMGLQPWGKLAAEVIAAFLAYFGGIQIHDFLGHPIPSFVGLPLTIFWLIGCTNAFNLIDGLDGLSTGIGLLATLTTLVVGLRDGDIGLVIAMAPLVGALLGFLIFNFNPATIFLGDSGSLWIGFMLACSGVIWSQKSVTALSITAPIMALFFPLLETGLSIARRFVRCEPIFHADRGHIHHQLLDRGLSPRRVVLLLYAFAAIGACFSLFQSTAPDMIRGVILIAFCAVVWYVIRYLRYQEFTVAAKLLRRSNVRSMVKSEFLLKQYEKLLIQAVTSEECWSVIQAISREFVFTHVELRLGGQTYKEQIDSSSSGHWVLHIPLSDVEYVRFNYRIGTSTSGPAIAQLADLLHRCLSAKKMDLVLQLAASNTLMPIRNLHCDASRAGTSVSANA